MPEEEIVSYYLLAKMSDKVNLDEQMENFPNTLSFDGETFTKWRKNVSATNSTSEWRDSYAQMKKN